jgi:dynein heavy chain 2
MVQGAMRAYEREFKELNIHLIEEVLDMTAYIERVLSMPGGCLLLAGRSGIARKACTQLVSQLLNVEFFSPNMNRDYGMKEFKRDLKYVL